MSGAVPAGEAPVLRGRGIPLQAVAAGRAVRPPAAPWLGGFAVPGRAPARPERRTRRIPPAAPGPLGDIDAAGAFDEREAWPDADAALAAAHGGAADPAGDAHADPAGTAATDDTTARTAGADLTAMPPGAAPTARPAVGETRRAGDADASRGAPPAPSGGAVAGPGRTADAPPAPADADTAPAARPAHPTAARPAGGHAAGGVGGAAVPEPGAARDTGAAGRGRGAGSAAGDVGGAGAAADPLSARRPATPGARRSAGPAERNAGRRTTEDRDPAAGRRDPPASPARVVSRPIADPAANPRAAAASAVDARGAGAGRHAAPRASDSRELGAAAVAERMPMGRSETARTGRPGPDGLAALLALRLDRGAPRGRRGGSGRRIEIGTLHVTVQPRPVTATASPPAAPPPAPRRPADAAGAGGFGGADPRAAFDVVFD
ncbi:MAG TPA: hypothetical protein VF188_01460 [Longimicrobiales bacterium]